MDDDRRSHVRVGDQACLALGRRAMRRRRRARTRPAQAAGLAAGTRRVFRQLQTRMQEDFRLGVIALCGLVSVAALGGFSVYRFVRGDIALGVVDFALVLTIIAAGVHAWHSGDSRIAGLMMIVANTIGCVVVAALAGFTGLFWAYNAVVMNFFLGDRHPAVFASMALVIVIAFLPLPGVEPAQRLSFCATCALVSLYAFVFAARASRQAVRLERLAVRDPLTGVRNRRLFDLDLPRAVHDARAGRSTPALAVLDLDHFKRINDRHGHDAGDRTLVGFTRILQAGLRQDDRLYRVGGEEFVLLLKDVQVAGLTVLIEHLLTLTRTRLRSPDGPVTVSIGAALLRPDEDSSEWLARADKAMYEAKTRRDCGVISG
jgi:diguanylate cyclase (GGDEF)-like protein